MNLVITDFVNFLQAEPLQKHFQWFTDVVRYDSGKEQRNQIMSRPVRHWFINWEMLPKINRDKLLEIFNRSKGRYDTFLFEDNDEKSTVCSFTQNARAITAIDQSAKTFTIGGDHAVDFPKDRTFDVAGSTGNDGIYTTVSASYDGTNTIIIVSEAIPNATADGNILALEFQLFATYYSGESESWNEDRKDIKPDNCTVKVDSVQKTEDTDYTLDDNTGILIFVPDVVGDTDIVEVTFNYYFRIRFAEDTHEDIMHHPGLWNAGRLHVIEVIS